VKAGSHTWQPTIMPTLEMVDTAPEMVNWLPSGFVFKSLMTRGEMPLYTSTPASLPAPRSSTM
jgi:hypothetical protein